MNDLLISEIMTEKNELLLSCLLVENYVLERKSPKDRRLDNNDKNNGAAYPKSIFAANMLDNFVQTYQGEVNKKDKEMDKIECLLNHFFIKQLFIDKETSSWPIAAHQLSTAIANRKISPILKAVLFNYLAKQCGIESDIVFLAKKLMIRLVCNGGYSIIFDPVTGESLNMIDLAIMRETSTEPFAIHIDIMSRESLILEYVYSFKQACIKEKQYRQALKCVDILLAIQSQNNDDRKILGILSHQLARFSLAVDDDKMLSPTVAQDIKNTIPLNKVTMADGIIH